MARVALLGLLVAAAGCSRPATPPAPAVASAPAQGIGSGVVFLLSQQSDDGAWRSDVYATFKDGTALTGLVVRALQDAADAGEPADAVAAREKASAWLAKFVAPDGNITEPVDGFPYPVYTSALSVIALSHADNMTHVKARDAWLEYLLARQLTEENGWTPGDKRYGGWGYYPRIPKMPAPGQAIPAQHLLESNLSATVFAVEARAAAGRRDAARDHAAQRFLLRCRNADGGFHFIYDDPVRNKAGTDGHNPNGEPRYRSYGSATADGARGLAICEAQFRLRHPNTAECPSVARGGEVDWLVKHFAADRHPGEYLPAFEPSRNAVYYYYAASVAKAFRALGVTEVNGRHWADRLTEALLTKQKPDGSWENDRDQQRENDPLVATAYAVSALAECRRAAR